MGANNGYQRGNKKMPLKLKTGSVITPGIQKKFKIIRNFIIGNVVHQVSELDKKIIFTEIRGECNYKKCNSACCRICPIINGNNEKWAKGFADKIWKGKFSNIYIINKRCNNLERNGKCRLYKKNGQPYACKVFPNLDDTIYWMVFNKCSKKIVVTQIHEIGKK